MTEPKRAGTLALFIAAWALNLAFDGLGWFAGLLPPRTSSSSTCRR